MTDRQIIDVHCHLFNAQYAIMELTAATWNHLWGNYPHQRGVARKRAAGRGVIEKLQGVKEFAAWIARMLDAALSDCEGNYDTALKKFAESSLGGAGLLVVAPLMMDVYFALDDNKDEEGMRRRGRRAVPVVEPFAIADDQKKRFEAHFEGIMGIIKAEIQKVPAAKRRVPAKETLDAIFDEAKQELLAKPRKARRGEDYEGIELSPGYKKHMHDLEDLCRKHPKLVFPFLAVDPRRIGIMKLIEMKIKKGKGVFKGVKFYPPLGYLPTHPNLEAIFEYCAQYDIPITVHCSQGGLRNFRDENYVRSWEGADHLEDFTSSNGNKSLYYTAPEKWAPVLKKWRNLRINFAHFGGGDKLALDDRQWLDAIIQIIQNHPKAYTDISYYVESGLAQKIARYRQTEYNLEYQADVRHGLCHDHDG